MTVYDEDTFAISIKNHYFLVSQFSNHTSYTMVKKIDGFLKTVITETFVSILLSFPGIKVYTK